MYVAITRARKRLYLSLSQTRMLHGQMRYNVRSRFLEELPEGCLKWLTPRTGGGRGGWGGGDWAAGGWGGGRDARSSSGAGDAGRAVTTLGEADRRAAARFDRGLPWRIGQTVAHAKFGEGVILNIEGGGSDARVQVNFGRQGIKWLALSVARLDAVN